MRGKVLGEAGGGGGFVVSKGGGVALFGFL